MFTGFLSLQNEDMPGNAGLLDQLLALRWAKNHSRTFCGDPDNITIFGASAGAASVTLLMISPLVEEGKFKVTFETKIERKVHATYTYKRTFAEMLSNKKKRF